MATKRHLVIAAGCEPRAAGRWSQIRTWLWTWNENGSGPGPKIGHKPGRKPRRVGSTVAPRSDSGRARWRRSFFSAALAGLAAATGCQGPIAGSLEVVPTQFAGAELVPIAAGDPVELVRPIQGGHVIFIGALVRGASGSRGTIRGELRRSETAAGQPLPPGTPGGIIVFEERSTTLVDLPAGTTPPSPAAGWQVLRADISDVANIPACPNFLPIEIPDRTLQIQIVYTDEKGNTGTALRPVMPRCTQAQTSARNLCLCECRANYTIERCFMPADGGVTD